MTDDTISIVQRFVAEILAENPSLKCLSPARAFTYGRRMQMADILFAAVTAKGFYLAGLPEDHGFGNTAIFDSNGKLVTDSERTVSYYNAVTLPIKGVKLLADMIAQHCEDNHDDRG